MQAERERGKRPKKEVVYKQPFFERPEHMLFCGNGMVVKTGGPMSGETTAQETELVGM